MAPDLKGSRQTDGGFNTIVVVDKPNGSGVLRKCDTHTQNQPDKIRSVQ